MTSTAIKHLSRAAAAWIIAYGPSTAVAQTSTIDASGGVSFNRGIFGHNAFAFSYDSYTAAGYDNRKLAFEKNQELWNNTSVRGMAGGAWADTYDWRTGMDGNLGVLNSQNQLAKGMSTLDQLRSARDRGTDLMLTVNTLKTTTGFDQDGNPIYAPMNSTQAAALAKDWVRYTNFILQNYRQGQEHLMSAADQQILSSINWTGSDYGTDKLLAPGEAAVPKVTYWEIGNEVEFNFSDTGYRSTYQTITTAMLGVDSTIKVGPGMAGNQGPLNGGNANVLKTVLGPGTGFSAPSNPTWLPVDFVAYHPYGYQILNVDAATDHAGVAGELNNLKANQQYEKSWVTDRINQNFGNIFSGAVYRPNGNSIELMATEWNPAYPSPPPGMDNNWYMRQWNALGIVETAMTYAEMGISAGHFWLWPAEIQTGDIYPQYHAFDALNEYGGDTLVDSYSEENFRLYITRDSETGTVAVWGMNFLYGDPGDAARTLHLSLENLGIEPGTITLKRLASLTERTTLISGNTGPTVGWISSELTGMDLSSFDFTTNPAELSLLIIQPVPEPSSAGILTLFAFVAARQGHFKRYRRNN